MIFRPSIAQIRILRRLPMSRAEVEALVAQDGRRQKTLRALVDRGLARWSEALDELQKVRQGKILTGLIAPGGHRGNHGKARVSDSRR